MVEEKKERSVKWWECVDFLHLKILGEVANKRALREKETADEPSLTPGSTGGGLVVRRGEGENLIQ